MDTKTNEYRAKIEAFFPQLPIKTLRPTYDHGLHNDLVLVNDELMVRFAKHDFSKDLLENEYRVIRLLKEKTEIPVPDMKRLDYGIVSYPYIRGENLFRHKLLQIDEIKQNYLMEKLGGFMHQMQSIPIIDIKNAGITVSPASTDNFHDFYEKLVIQYERIKKELYPHMRAYTCACVDAAYKGLEKGEPWFEFKPSLIHGDLALEHVIVDNSYNNITGILDFGVAGSGNPAHDMGVLLDGLGESLVSKMAISYPGLNEILARSRVGLSAAAWHLRGIDTGDLFWHLVHLMTAKDIYY